MKLLFVTSENTVYDVYTHYDVMTWDTDTMVIVFVEQMKREKMRTIPATDKEISALYHSYTGGLLPENLNPHKVLTFIVYPKRDCDPPHEKGLIFAQKFSRGGVWWVMWG